MDEQLISALNAIPVADLDRSDWLAVGMALKEEGYSCAVWDQWSQNDKRYHKGECERLWNGFRGTSKPVKAGTIVQMAKGRGWTPWEGDGILDWNSTIEYDGISEEPPSKAWKPTEDLITYLRLLFEPNEYVAYVTNDVYRTDDGKWVPSKGIYTRTAEDLIESLEKHPNDIGYAVGDWKEEAGAWIRFNPVDGAGVKNENVTAFRYALVESDTLPIQEQDEMYRQLELPIAALVYSGGKSLHAIVHIDAKDEAEYYERVNFLYEYLSKNGLDIDKQNRNPSRLSRMPGVTRNGKMQYLAATNIGRKNWSDWMDFVEGNSDDLPEIVTLSADIIKNPPKLPEVLIDGILRCGHKMIISGASKAGKSFALIELAIAIAEGREWLGFQCKKGRVLYINLEIDPRSIRNRFSNIYNALKLEPKCAQDIAVWDLRGFAVPLDQLAPKIIRRIRNMNLDAVILDPIYKVITGDENNASEMGKFCNNFDRICEEAGVAMIYCHHHSKGAQGAKKVIDRASGSGVFARDPDAQLDLIELELSDDLTNNVQDNNATAWRLESSLREFPNIKPVNIWFEYPIHRVDTSGELTGAYAQGSKLGNLKNHTTENSRKQSIDNAFDVCSINLPVTIDAMAKYLGVTSRTVRDRVKEYSEKYYIKYGCVFKNEGLEIEK